jgi:hypothetical protein
LQAHHPQLLVFGLDRYAQGLEREVQFAARLAGFPASARHDRLHTMGERGGVTDVRLLGRIPPPSDIR